MQYGALCDKDGNIKRTWALVDGHCAVPIEHGDEVIEWEIKHDVKIREKTLQRKAQSADSLAMQENLVEVKTRDEALSLSDPHVETRQHRRFVGPATPAADRETMFHSEGRLVSRAQGATHVPRDEAEGHIEEVVAKGKQ